MAQIKKTNNLWVKLGSCCSTVDSVIASEIRGPRFASNNSYKEHLLER